MKIYIYLSLVLISCVPIISFNGNKVKGVHDVVLKLSTTKEAINLDSSLVLFNAELFNNSQGNIAILNRTSLTSNDLPTINWIVDIFYKDSIQMYFYQNYFDDTIIPSSDDYVLLSNKDIFNFNFTIDFNKLGSSISNAGKNNERYGDYSLRLYYHDRYCKNKKALKERIESNIIKIRYFSPS